MNSFMSWIGGKKSIRALIVSLFPLYYERYIEVFGGGGWVLFHKPPSYRVTKAPVGLLRVRGGFVCEMEAEADKLPGNDFEVYNDFNSQLVNLYRCVRENPPS